jgi:hypothetical protein
MSIVRNRYLWALVGAGLALRVVLAFAFFGTNAVTVEQFAAGNVRAWDWHAVYAPGLTSWPYPPLFLTWLAGASWLSDVTGWSFHGLAKLGPSLADAGLAVAVYVYLGWRGAADRVRLAGAALVMLGPIFIATSAYHGQFDAVAILPAVLAVMVWERRPESTRAFEAGALIGLGGALKTVPLLVALPLLCSAWSWREGTKLVATAILIPALALGPLWAAGIDLHRVTHYTGVPGWGGLSLVVHPGLGWDDLASGPVLGHPGGLTTGLQSASRWITLGALVAYAMFILRYRPALIDAVALLWLVVFAFSPNFFLTYLVWGLPFFIMAGYLVEVGMLQAVLVIPAVGYYLSLWPAASSATAILYVPFMIGLWVVLAAAMIAVGVRTIRGGRAYPALAQPPLVDVPGGRSG